MTETIQQTLTHLEAQYGFRILFAIESGSRAWGFHSPDSDYDVRFAYMHPKDWYLGIEDKKDFMETPKDPVLDIGGYDIRKLLKLFRASNAKIYEWLQSPIVYRSDDAFLTGLCNLVPHYYSSKAGIHHYLGLTRNTFDTYLSTEHIRLKKYFYALRPVLAASWIMTHDACPPMEFAHLREEVKDNEINKRIDRLLEQKAGVGEGFLISPDPLLHQFIQERMAACLAHAQTLEKKEPDVQPLNDLFRQTIGL